LVSTVRLPSTSSLQSWSLRPWLGVLQVCFLPMLVDVIAFLGWACECRIFPTCGVLDSLQHAVATPLEGVATTRLPQQGHGHKDQQTYVHDEDLSWMPMRRAPCSLEWVSLRLPKRRHLWHLLRSE